jgi:EAL domain-containing protein (putative c-di-GMP-specific phosphodiesterase class I)
VETSGLDPACLHLELTETAIIDLHPDLLHQLGEIRDLGVEIGLDDFGTGYASLTHLRRLPLTFVKIDQSFVQGLGSHSGDDRIVAAVVDLATNLRLRSIGEGVETPEQLERLRELGCDQARASSSPVPWSPATSPPPSCIRRGDWAPTAARQQPSSAVIVVGPLGASSGDVMSAALHGPRAVIVRGPLS